MDRIRLIYEMLNPENFAGEYVKGYFELYRYGYNLHWTQTSISRIQET
ncbi:hypothetical protein [Paenibacillus pabuli]|nr:hypothetical protein [Paenibacillus pabuli]UPK45427.1 hypothetical protein KET34_08150 [Paenibacillus pabuli]